MGIAIRRSSKWWYAQFQVGGERRTFRLGVKVRGVRPDNLRLPGDADFEASRAQAMIEADRLERDAQAEGADLQYHRRMAGLLGERKVAKPKVKPIPVAALFEAWTQEPSRPRSDGYVARVRALCKEFGRFAEQRGLRHLRDIRPEHAVKFIDGERARATPGTVNSKLVTLRSVFHRIARKAGLESNPFDGVATLPDRPIHRRPLTEEEIDRLIEACDGVIRGPVITAACTALRRADACCLRWEAVDMLAGFVRVRTQKTGGWAEVPIFDRLQSALEAVEGPGEPDEFVWPEAAAMYKANPSGISYRVRRAMKTAGIERSVRREHGINRNASVADFHALRTAWITRALTLGVPLETVRRVSGHTTTAIVLEHYYRPGRAEFKRALRPMMTPRRARKKREPDTPRPPASQQE